MIVHPVDGAPIAIGAVNCRSSDGDLKYIQRHATQGSALAPWRSALGSVDGERIDAVEAASIIVEGELLRAWPPWTAAGRRPGGQAQVLQDLAGGAFVLDGRDQLHPLATPWTAQNLEVPGAAHQRGPGQAALSAGIVGTIGITGAMER